MAVWAVLPGCTARTDSSQSLLLVKDVSMLQNWYFSIAFQAVDAYRTYSEIMSFSCCALTHGKPLEDPESRICGKTSQHYFFSDRNLVQGAFEVRGHGQLKMPLQHRKLRCDRKYSDRLQLSAKLKPTAVLQTHKPCVELSDLQRHRKICKAQFAQTSRRPTHPTGCLGM